MAARPASGEQFILESGGARAVIGQVAAVLREFSVDGVLYTETWDDAVPPPFACGIVLAPWPNRVADGRWMYNGQLQQLDITEVERGHALHGLLRHTAYEFVASGEDFVELAAIIAPQHGYPFHLRNLVRYEVGDEGLLVTHEVTNLGGQPAPFGIGVHPFFRIGDVPTTELVLTVEAESYMATSELLIPIGSAPTATLPWDPREGVRVGDMTADTALTGIAAPDGYLAYRLDAPDGRSLVVWAEPAFGWVQLFTTREFPGPDGPRFALAIEPMTCGIDAFNRGDGLRWLEPDTTWSASWGARPD